MIGSLGDIFNSVFIFPILNLLIGFFKLFLMLHLPGAFGFAIISLTFLVRLILYPFFKQQMHTSMKMQEMKPHMDKLSKKHKDDPKKLQQEQLRMYQEAGINPMAGCVFAIIQIPIILGLYNSLNMLLKDGVGNKTISEINKVLYWPFLKISTVDPWFFGFNLALAPAKTGQWHYYLIPVITGILQYFQAKTTLPPAPQTSTDDKDKSKEKASTSDDFQKAMNTQMKYFFPVMIAYFSYTLPVGLSLYWNIFSIVSIIQNYRLQAARAIAKEIKKDIKEVKKAINI